MCGRYVLNGIFLTNTFISKELILKIGKIKI
jgi:hypothetical protein